MYESALKTTAENYALNSENFRAIYSLATRELNTDIYFKM
jgi:hypothetical protein